MSAGALILDGAAVAAGLRSTLAERVRRLVGGGAARPRLALVEFNPTGPEAVYAARLARAAEEIGIEAERLHAPPSIALPDLERLLSELNADSVVAGIVLVHPLPAQIDREEAVTYLDPEKDVDGGHPLNAGRLVRGRSAFVPATALAVMAILAHYQIPVAGRRAVVIGRSAVVGRPVAGLLLQANATVTVCHRETPDLPGETRRAEILVAAAGSPQLVQPHMVDAGCVVIDAGYNTTDAGVIGDADFVSLRDVVLAITPVPGGVGRVAPTMVLEQTVRSAERAAGGSEAAARFELAAAGSGEPDRDR